VSKIILTKHELEEILSVMEKIDSQAVEIVQENKSISARFETKSIINGTTVIKVDRI